jgi:hypothetical protein
MSGRFRNWLTVNKIYFETVTVALLSVMAILVSVSANAIQRYQITVLKAQSIPVLLFKVDLIRDPVSGVYYRDALKISNIGGPVSEFKAEPRVRISVRYGGINKSLKSATIPLLGYYDTQFVTGEPKDLLAILENASVNEGNNTRATTMLREFEKVAKKEGPFEFVLTELQRYVQVSYKDLWDDQHGSLYEIHPIQGGSRLSGETGKLIITDYEAEVTKGIALDFARATLGDLVRRFFAAIR